MSKITKQEFENYNKQFLPIFARMMKTPEFKSESEKGQEKITDLLGFSLNEIKSGNIAALYNACKLAKEVLKEDFSAIERRVKEHILARGYYNPTSPLTLAEFRERRNKMG